MSKFYIGQVVKVNAKNVGTSIDKSKVARWQGWGYVVKNKANGIVRVSITKDGRGDQFLESDLSNMAPIEGYSVVKRTSLDGIFQAIKAGCGIHSGAFARAFVKVYSLVGSTTYTLTDREMLWYAGANDLWRDFLVDNGYIEKKAKYCECCGQKLPA